MLCMIWYYLYNLKIVKNTLGGVLLLVKLQASSWNFTKTNTPFFFFLCKVSHNSEIRLLKRKQLQFQSVKRKKYSQIKCHIPLELGVTRQNHFSYQMNY